MSKVYDGRIAVGETNSASALMPIALSSSCRMPETETGNAPYINKDLEAISCDILTWLLSLM